MLAAHKGAVERLVYGKLKTTADAEDVLQEVCLTAFQHFPELLDKTAFKPWLLTIARNKCRDYYRKKAAMPEVLTGTVRERLPAGGGFRENPVVDTLLRLSERDREILILCFWQELTGAEMAERLGIPIGTVKSRLHTARRHFRELYPYPTRTVVCNEERSKMPMKTMPNTLPAYTIEPSPLPPFALRWEEMRGWLLVPKLGEGLTFGQYDMPTRRLTELCEMQVTGAARVHGIDGVEISARCISQVGERTEVEYTFIEQLTETHCRTLAVCCREEGFHDYITFLDGEGFLPDWGFGENNIGRETHLAARGIVTRQGSEITCHGKAYPLDVVGRYNVTLTGATYDTVCVVDVCRDAGTLLEQFLDSQGKTILLRRYNRDNWGFSRYGQTWSRMFPNNDRLTVDGETYVHWYDCVTDYVFGET